MTRNRIVRRFANVSPDNHWSRPRRIDPLLKRIESVAVAICGGMALHAGPTNSLKRTGRRRPLNNVRFREALKWPL